MRWYLVYRYSISLWFILTAQGSPTTDRDICSSVIDGFNLGSGIVKFVVEDTVTVPTDCSCAITTFRPASYLCPLNQSAPCPSDYHCTPDECVDSIVDLNSVTTCISMSIKRVCSQGSDKIDSCSNSTNFTIDLSLTPSIECSRKSNGFQIILQAFATTTKRVFRAATCSARSLTSDGPRAAFTPTTLNSWTTPDAAAAAATEATKRNRMIGGIVVAVFGGGFLVATIIIVNVVSRIRQGKPKKPRAKKMSQTGASVPIETAYESYTVPASVAYENAAIGSPLSYQILAFDNEAIGESNDGYTEVKEPEETSNHNGYDNGRIGRNEAYSMRHELGKEYDNVSDSQSSNIEDETTVIDNELYA